MTEPPTSVCTGAVLFADLVGFTEYNNVVGDSDAVAVLDTQTRLAAHAVETLDRGRVVKELGDGLMCWFDSPARAIDAALDLMAMGTFPLAIRMGVHHGDGVQRGGDVAGNTINVGARIAHLARPGELLVSDDALSAIGDTGDISCAAVGPVRVKGVAEPIWIPARQPPKRDDPMNHPGRVGSLGIPSDVRTRPTEAG